MSTVDREVPLSYMMASEAHALAELMGETVRGITDTELFVADDRASLARYIHHEGQCSVPAEYGGSGSDLGTFQVAQVMEGAAMGRTGAFT